MSAEFATKETHDAPNPIADVRIYWRVSGLALAAVAALGILLTILGGNNTYLFEGSFMQDFLVFDWTHNVVHVALAAIALTFGFGSFSSALSANMAKVIGVTYLGLGVLGFVPGVVELLDTLLALHLEVGENLVHLILGAWGAYAGFSN